MEILSRAAFCRPRLPSTWPAPKRVAGLGLGFAMRAAAYHPPSATESVATSRDADLALGLTPNLRPLPGAPPTWRGIGTLTFAERFLRLDVKGRNYVDCSVDCPWSHRGLYRQ